MDIAELGFKVDSSDLVKGERALNRVDKAGQRVEKRSTRIKSSFKGLFAGIGLTALAADTFRASASLESMSASLKTVTGSSQAASDALKEIEEFARTTPFQLEQSVQGFIKLRALGLDPSIESLRAYGNTASALGKSLNQAVEAVADAAVGEFERLKEFGIRAKTQGDLVTFTFQGVSTTVRKEAGAIEGYLRRIGEVNFAGAMEEQAGTLNGVLSNLRDSFTKLQQDFFKTTGLGDSVKDAMLRLTAGFTSLTSSLVTLAPYFPAIGSAVQAFVLTFAAVRFLPPLFTALAAQVSFASNAIVLAGVRGAASAGAFAALAGSTRLLSSAMALLGGPAGVIAIAASALVFFISKSQQAKNANNDFIASINSSAATQGLNDSLNKTREIISGLESDLKGAEQALASAEARGAGGFAGINSGAISARARVNELRAELGEARKASGVLTEQIEEQAKQTELLGQQTEIASDSSESLSDINKDLKKTLDNSTSSIEKQTKAQEELRQEQERLARATGTDLIRSQEDLNRTLDEAEKFTENYARALENAKQALTGRGLIEGTKEYQKALEDLGFQTEMVAEQSKDAVTVIRDEWDDARRSVFNSFRGFFREGLSGFKNFSSSVKDTIKDMVADILAQLATLLASNVFKRFLSFVSGGKLGSNTGLFSGISGGGGGGLLGGITSAIGSIFKPSASTPGLGEAVGAGSGILGALGSVLGGNTSAVGPVIPGSISGLLSPTGFIGQAFTSIKGFFGGLGKSLASAFGAIPVWGQIALGIGALVSIFKSGARSPQQLGEDQLAAVDQATREGRNEQVQLGQTAGVSLSFLGGFDENSTFFGIDLLKDELQKVGDVLKEQFGFKQALALKDGVIRLEDFSREFSKNNDQIVAEVQASIATVKLAFDNSERDKLKTLGRSVTAFDRLYDQSANSGKSAADRIREAYAGAFGVSQEVAQTALDNIGVSSDRLAEIFDAASNSVLENMLGISSQAGSTAQIIEGSFNSARARIEGSWQGLDLGQPLPVNIPTVNVPVTTQQAPAQAQQQQETPQQQAAREASQRVADNLDEIIPFIQQVAARG